MEREAAWRRAFEWRKRVAWAASLLLSTTLLCPSSIVSSDARISRLEARYRRAKTLSSSFLERYWENGKQVRAEAGKAYFLRPGKMRWEYEAPEKTVFLVDGKYVWFYTPADHTATRMPVKQSEDWRTPIAFLTTGMRMERICSKVEPVDEPKAAAADAQMYGCALKGGEGKERFFFEVSAGDELARILVPQEGGRMIEFDFGQWQWDPALPNTMFSFTPPLGTAIVEGVLPEAPGMRQ